MNEGLIDHEMSLSISSPNNSKKKKKRKKKFVVKCAPRGGYIELAQHKSITFCLFFCVFCLFLFLFWVLYKGVFEGNPRQTDHWERIVGIPLIKLRCCIDEHAASLSRSCCVSRCGMLSHKPRGRRTSRTDSSVFVFLPGLPQVYYFLFNKSGSRFKNSETAKERERD